MKNSRTINRVLLLALCALTSLKAAEIRQDSVGAGDAQQSFVTKVAPILMVLSARKGDIEKLKELRVAPPVKVDNKRIDIIDAPAVLEGEQINPLMAAAKAGQTEAVKWLLDQGAVLWKDKAIDAATAAGHLSIAQLIQQSIDAESGDEDEGDWNEFYDDPSAAPSLFELARRGNIPDLVAGISKAFPRATPDEQKKIMGGLLSQVRSEPAKATAPSAIANIFGSVLPGSAQHSADVGAGAGQIFPPLENGVISQQALDLLGKEAREVLLLGYCRSGNCDAVRFLVGKNKVNINARDPHGMTPWLIAAHMGDTNLGALCLVYKADLSVKNIDEQGAAQLAKPGVDYFERVLTSIKYINENKAQMQAVRGATKLSKIGQIKRGITFIKDPFAWIQYSSDTSTLDLLIGKTDINSIKDEAGDTLLMFAAIFNRPNVIEWLLARGADATVKNQNGQTALDIAQTYYHERIAQILLKHMGLDKIQTKVSGKKKKNKKKKEKSAEQIAQEQQERQAQEEQERKDREQKEQKEREAQEKEKQRKAQSERDKARATQERKEKEKAAAAEREKQEKNRLEQEKRRAEKAQKETEQARLTQQEKEKKDREEKERKEAEEKRDRERIRAIEAAAATEKKQAKAENQILSQINEDVETAQRTVAMAETLASKTLSTADECALYISNFEKFASQIKDFISKSKRTVTNAGRLARLQELQRKLGTAKSRVDELLAATQEKQKRLAEKEEAQIKERARRQKAIESRKAQPRAEQTEQRSASAPTVQAAERNPVQAVPQPSSSVTISPPVLGGLTIEQQLAQEMAELKIKEQRVAQLKALVKPAAASRGTHDIDEKASRMSREFNRKQQEEERALLARSTARETQVRRTPPVVITPPVAMPAPAPSREDEVDAAPTPVVSVSRPALAPQPAVITHVAQSVIPAAIPAQSGVRFSQQPESRPAIRGAGVPALPVQQRAPFATVPVSASMPMASMLAARSHSAMAPASVARPAAPRPLSEPVVLSESDLVQQMRQHKSWLDKDLARIKEQVRAESEQPHYLEEVGITSDMDDLALSMLKSLDEC